MSPYACVKNNNKCQNSDSPPVLWGRCWINIFIHIAWSPMFNIANWKSVSFTLGLSLVFLFCVQISHGKSFPVEVNHHEAPYEKHSTGCVLGSCEVPLSKEKLQVNLSISFFPDSNVPSTFQETFPLFKPRNPLLSSKEIPDDFEYPMDLFKLFSAYLIWFPNFLFLFVLIFVNRY